MNHTAEYYRERYASSFEARDSARASARKYQRKIRSETIKAYGGICVCCGESEEAFLTFDHINDDGASHRRSLGGPDGHAIVFWAKRNGYPNILQVLCYNCNMAKARGGCPHNA